MNAQTKRNNAQTKRNKTQYKRTFEQTVETEIEFSPDGKKIIGWCKTLRDLGLFNCTKDCETCFCG